MHPELAILINLTVCLSAALVLGFITHKLKLSPIVGYLLAGVSVGPQTPGFVADRESAAQLAEVGVVLLMFGVGMHFDLRDLLAVRRVAVPGAFGQVLVATLVGMFAVAAAGWGWTAGVVIGMSVSVASTVVLIRVLEDNQVLETDQGHLAVGWLIVEDLFTVFVLVLMPALASAVKGEGATLAGFASALGLAILKIAALGLIVLWGGRKLIPRVLEHVARTRTRELFTLAILALALTIATGSALIFGVSMALGAFLAGMVVGQSQVSHQAAADALPMRDAFAVLFFVSVGMLFDPRAILNAPLLFLGLLAVILIAKPLAAIVIVWALGYSMRSALTVAVGLAQIGEFSFILADLAAKHGLLRVEGQGLLVACAILTITLNPLLFRTIGPWERWLQSNPRLWQFLTRRAEIKLRQAAPELGMDASGLAARRTAIIVGYGPVGMNAAAILNDFGVDSVIVDLNVDTVRKLLALGKTAVYGDATQRTILEAAGVQRASYLLVTTPDLQTRTVIVLIARELNPDLKVFVRARYMAERAWLEEIGATEACFEEAEAAIGLAVILLREMGADEERVRKELRRTRARLAFHSGPLDASQGDAVEPPQPENSTSELPA